MKKENQKITAIICKRFISCSSAHFSIVLEISLDTIVSYASCVVFGPAISNLLLVNNGRHP